MARQRVTILFLVFLTVVALALCFVIFKPFVGPLLTAAVIAIVFFPVHAKVLKWVHRSSLAALLSTILVVLLVIVPAVAIGVAITQEVTDLYHELGERSTEIGGWSPYFGDLLSRLLAWVGRYL